MIESLLSQRANDEDVMRIIEWEFKLGRKWKILEYGEKSQKSFLIYQRKPAMGG
jgi:hypothetical protein